MRILIVSQHYWPETVGTARRAWTLAEFLAGRGHRVRVLSGRPNHPSMQPLFGQGHDGFERHNGVEIQRLPVYRVGEHAAATRTDSDGLNSTDGAGNDAQKPGPQSFAHRLPLLGRLHRLGSYGSWWLQGSLSAFQLRLKQRLQRSFHANASGTSGADAQAFEPEVILAISPLPTGLIGATLQALHPVPLVFDLQDIWPEAVLKAGLLGPVSPLGEPVSPEQRLLVAGLEALEKEVYARSSALVVLSKGFKTSLKARGFDEKRIHVISNGVDATPYRALHQEVGIGPGGFTRPPLSERWRTAQGFAPDDLVVLYAGNLGLMQDLDVLIDAATMLRHVPQLKVVLMGGGIERERLKKRIEGLQAEQPSAQIRLLDHQSAEKMPGILMGADVLFLSLKPGQFSAGTVPSKLYDYLIAGRPIVNMAGDEAANVLEEANAGISLNPGDLKGLKVALFALYADRGMRERLGRSGQQWVLKEASLEVIGARYETLLSSLVEKAQ